MMRTPLRATLFAGALLGMMAPDLAEAAPVSEKSAAAANGAVNITSVATEIEIVGTSKKEVSVKGDLPDGFNLVLTTKKKSTEIQVKPPKGKSRGKGKLRIEVPAGSDVHAKTVSGDLDSSGITGDVSLTAVSGNVTSTGNAHEVDVTTVSGNVKADGGKKRTGARAVSGRVTITGARGKLEASTVSGNLHIEKAKVTRSDLQAVSGSIEFEGSLEGPGPHEMKTHAGSVTIAIPRGAPVEIDAASHAGSIHDRVSGTRARNRATIKRGSGGPRVKVRTFAGGITIEGT